MSKREYPWLSLAQAERWMAYADELGVSAVARGAEPSSQTSEGFMEAYAACNGSKACMRKRPATTNTTWAERRQGFIRRHLAQMRERGEPLWDEDGLPTRRHLGLIAWAYSPKPSQLRKRQPPRANAGDWKVPPVCKPKDTDHPTVKASKGDKVRVHRNLHNGCWVVSKRGKVVGYATGITLRNVRPRVGQAGYERCNRDQTRNVHAYLEGEFVSARAAKPKGWKRISYNCKKRGPYFYYTGAGGKRFEGAAEVRLVQSKSGKAGVYVKGQLARENPPPCPCTAPGGLCSCGTVDAQAVRETEPSCGDPGGAEGVVVVQVGPALVMLDVSAVKRIRPERFWEDSCPTVLGYASPSGRAARRGWEEALENAQPEPDAGPVLAWLGGIVGGSPDKLAEHLVSNGEGWVAYELSRGRALNNPGKRVRPPMPGTVELPAEIPVAWAVGPRADEMLGATINYTRGWELIEVPIDRIMALAGSMGIDLEDPSPRRVWWAKWWWSQGGAMDPPQLGLATRDAVLFDDGRHRLAAAWQLGERTAPVLVPPGEGERILQLVGVQHNPPRKRWKVRSERQGVNALKHPDIERNYKAALRFKPKHRTAVLLPCAQTKPFTEAPSYTGGYLPALEGKDADLWVVSEPLGIVPLAWAERYPNAHYDFPPRYLTGRAHDILSGRVARWMKVVGPKYDRIVLALPGHHARLVEKGLEMLGYNPTAMSYAGIGDCLDSGACPTGHYRATTKPYRRFLRRRVRSNPPGPRGAGQPLYMVTTYYPQRDAWTGEPYPPHLAGRRRYSARWKGDEGQEYLAGEWDDPAEAQAYIDAHGWKPLPNPYVGYTDPETHQRHYLHAEEADLETWAAWLESTGQLRVEVADTRPRNATPASFVPSLQWVKAQMARTR